MTGKKQPVTYLGEYMYLQQRYNLPLQFDGNP